MQWNIQLLGGLRAERDGRIVTRFRTQKTGALLAYLAYHSQKRHSREVLVEQFWPDLDAAAPRMSLSVALSSLRRQLEPPDVPAGSVLLADRFSVQLNPEAVQVDVCGFEAALVHAKNVNSSEERVRWLAASVDHYAGELLPGYYEEWCMAERERLATAYLRALGELMRACRQSGDLDGALHHAWRAVAADPFQEPLHQELLGLLLEAGQPATALRQYRELERLLRQELKRSPSPASVRLYQEIERHGSAPGVLAATAVAGRGLLRSASRSGTSSMEGALLHGTVTFLLADEFPEGLLLEHGALELPRMGSTHAAVFSGAGRAVACALASLLTFPATGPTKSRLPRLALLTTEIYGATPDYPGALQRAAQLLDVAEPGQVLCGEQTAGLVGPLPSAEARFLPLRSSRLPEGSAPERVFEVQPLAPSERIPTTPPEVSPGRPVRLPRGIGRVAGHPSASVPAVEYPTG